MLLVNPTKKINGTVYAPPSKSYTHRAVICAGLANGTSKIIQPLKSQDCISSLNAMKALGSTIDIKKSNDDELENEVWTISSDGNLKVPKNVIDIGNSGTTLRILTSLVSQIPHNSIAILNGDESIRKRPMGPLIEALSQLNIEVLSNDNKAPLVVKSSKIDGNIVKITGDMSSQFISSLMMLLPFNTQDSKILIEGDLKSEPYLNITIDLLDKFGVSIKKDEINNINNINKKNKTNKKENAYLIKANQTYKATDYIVEGDYSSASYLIALGVLLDSDITIKNLFKDSKQGDKEIINIVKRMGADLEIRDDEVIIKNSKFKLKGIDIDVKNTPDLVPTLAVLGCFAEGTTTIYNGEHVRIKECDRLMACTKELKKMGAKIEEKPDGLIIQGLDIDNGETLKGAELETYHDHRLIMAFTMAGMLAKGQTKIKGEEAVSISFPNFVDVIKSIGGNIAIE
ncbi:3-phosphoshikimate 1-carboxyvinyltransferase [Methanococcus voltae]|uniref:3-phosphoshikimate 1-carboxyvinyltransferase n=1 Tax=Methanococcus voltae (strain ATCC BAA-1334 / A3) TaxID=456320 RepID=D7DR43_METV3|nr:3-phosphoshikimate 1-carboxyvinyltransferase [Methanococcus voltae]MCS3900980.1 3-phosphoshikimate 1-carboxyvinyltransferase [Methanococcus voltae]